MKTMNDIPASRNQKVLLFGAPKTGKTQLAGELAAEFNVLLFSLENGHATLQKLPQEWKQRIQVVNIPDTRSFPIAIQTMLKVIKGGTHRICDKHGAINCLHCGKEGADFTEINLHELPPNTVVVVDSLTQLTNSAIAHITKAESDDYKLTYDDWGNLGKLMDIFLSHVQQAPFSIVCISHETEAEYEDGKKKIVPVSGTRNSSRNTAKYFDHVIYAEVKNGKHVFGSSSLYNTSIVAGSRTGVALEKMASPSLLQIMRGEVGTTTAPVSTDTQGQAALRNVAGMVQGVQGARK